MTMINYPGAAERLGEILHPFHHAGTLLDLLGNASCLIAQLLLDDVCLGIFYRYTSEMLWTFYDLQSGEFYGMHIGNLIYGKYNIYLYIIRINFYINF